MFCWIALTQGVYLPSEGSNKCNAEEHNKVSKYEVWCISFHSGEVNVFYYSWPKLWSSAQTNAHEELLSPPVDGIYMPCQLTSEEANQLK